MNIITACFFDIFYMVIADMSFRNSHLKVHRADIMARHGEQDTLLGTRDRIDPPPCGYGCERCVQDDSNGNTQKLVCVECISGYGLKHEAKECDNLLNCQNECVPCEVHGCAHCSTLASSCASCEDKLTLLDGKCHADDSEGGGWDWTTGTSAKRSGKEVNMLQEVNLVPFQTYGIAYTALGAVLYMMLALAVAFCYMRLAKGPRVESASGYLPEDGFSDAICECGQSWSTCFWSCCCPCIRWSDTVSQMNFLSFYLGVAIWCALSLCNTLVVGIGFVLISFLGAYHRMKIRSYFGLPQSCMTGCQDVIAWLS